MRSVLCPSLELPFELKEILSVFLFISMLQNYDPEKAQEDMIKTGLFNAINARGEVNKEVFE